MYTSVYGKSRSTIHGLPTDIRLSIPSPPIGVHSRAQRLHWHPRRLVWGIHRIAG